MTFFFFFLLFSQPQIKQKDINAEFKNELN